MLVFTWRQPGGGVGSVRKGCLEKYRLVISEMKLDSLFTRVVHITAMHVCCSFLKRVHISIFLRPDYRNTVHDRTFFKHKTISQIINSIQNVSLDLINGS